MLLVYLFFDDVDKSDLAIRIRVEPQFLLITFVTYAAVKERTTLRNFPYPNAKTAFFSLPYENSRLMIPFPCPGRRPGRGKIFSLP